MSDQHLRTQLTNALTMRQAHMIFEDAIRDFPVTHINTRPPGVEYTFWHLLEHLRITQWDILDYIRNPDYQHREWPGEYWPAPNAETDAAGWQHTIDQFLEDRAALVAIVQNPATDFYTPIPHGYDNHNILREILIIAGHNAYHIGELGILRQVVGIW
ncbi:MAG: DinB family protein [Anaerolineae bacterium]